MTKTIIILIINIFLFLISLQKINAQPYGNTISGKVYEDRNSNLRQDPGEPGYANATITLSDDGFGSTNTDAAGNYSFTDQFPGNYTLTLTVPGGYTATTTNPRAIRIVNSNVTVDFGITNTSGNNIVNLNFGLILGTPWFQCIGGDCRIDGGFDDNIPSSAIAACGGPYAAVQSPSSTTPGVIFSGNRDPYFGSGNASDVSRGWNWTIGNTSNPEVFTPVNSGIVRTSYSYLLNIARQSGITPTDLSSICNINDCSLPIVNFANGVYISNGGLSLNAYTFPANRDYVILVNGTLTIKGNILVPSGSSAVFSTTQNIEVLSSVGEVSPSSSAANIEGFYSAGGSFFARGTNNCLVATDRRLNINGGVVVNAKLLGGSFFNQRDMCDGNLSCPTITFSQRSDFILNSPTFIKTPNYIWQEVAP